MQLAITDIPGFRCWGAHIGIKSKRRDLAMIVCDEPATAAAVFTQNVVVAEPVKLSRRHIKDGKAQAFVVNSGNANACTGKDGEKGAVAMAEAAAEALGIDKKLVIVSSTGLIGEPFPTKKVVQGIHDNVIKLTRRGVASTLCANAILTTDTFAKEAGEQFEIDGTKVGISGIAKGSGMIHPNMATMLAFIVSDVKITKNLLDEALRESVGRTFNMITVDGDTSTNDMVAIMCSGKADHPMIRRKDRAYQSFRRALDQICEQLARLIVSDGEGATKFVEYVVEGARDDEAARKIARTVSDSTLVKTAIFGHDPNWGRIMGAAGRAGVDFDPDKVDLSITAGETLKILEGGQPVKIRRSTLAKRMKESFLKVTIGLNEGSGRAVSWGTDLSYEYVRINAEYTT
ncbi:MAG TPA: bifunctional glutamate N-acetyltransferase/amino-acid acetyltransferase ArgJ [Candidatus Krumholzibacteria bacterium]|nr:bifunctional glutamate N-acetyltransferase/amino-acid acetyltransferase ArgJ [Candidatus Krumholzibacteria bacterium]